MHNYLYVQVSGEPYESPCARDAENLPPPHSGRYLHLQVRGIHLKGLGHEVNILGGLKMRSVHEHMFSILFFDAYSKFLLSFMKHLLILKIVPKAPLEFMLKPSFFLISQFSAVCMSTGGFWNYFRIIIRGLPVCYNKLFEKGFW